MARVRIDEGVTVIAAESPTGERIEGPAEFECDQIWYGRRKTHDGIHLYGEDGFGVGADEPEPEPVEDSDKPAEEEPEPEATDGDGDPEPSPPDPSDVDTGVDVPDIPDELPGGKNHADLVSLAFSVAKARGDELTSRGGDYLRNYLTEVRDG